MQLIKKINGIQSYTEQLVSLAQRQETVNQALTI